VAQIYLPTPLRRLTQGQARVSAAGRTVDEALAELERRYPGLKEQLREPTGEVRQFINIFVNGTEIRSLQGGATPLADADEVSIIPAMAGGARSVEESWPPLATARPALGGPVLRMVELSRLQPHEEADPVRVERLAAALERDGVLRNPPIVAAPEGAAAAIVLDGANRVAALGTLGAAHVAVQVVRYADPEVLLSTWVHAVRLRRPPGLIARAEARRLPIERSTGARKAGRQVRRGGGLAAVIEAGEAAVLAPGVPPAEQIPVLRDLVALYGPDSDVHRLDGDDIDLEGAAAGVALVVFAGFRKRDLMDLVARGVRLPAGITRHLIPGRALRCNVPLAWLRSADGTAAKQARLDEAIDARWRAHGIRYYAESTYLFDE
jgi:molybdopterin synthase sulfur carrier subunit